jgi:CRP-like cAMP-binding protein
MFGEAALTSRQRQGAYVQAMEPSDVVPMSLDIFRRLVREKPEVGLKAIELLGERLYFYESKMVDMGLKVISAHLANLLLHLRKRGHYDS